jgi:hypothetical protein
MRDDPGADHQSGLRRLLRGTAAKPRRQIGSIERIAGTPEVSATAPIFIVAGAAYWLALAVLQLLSPHMDTPTLVRRKVQ